MIAPAGAAPDRPPVPTSTSFPLALANGEEVPLTLTFRLLNQLRAKDKAAYKAYSAAFASGISADVLGALDVVYAAYLCGQIELTGGVSGAYSHDVFVYELVPDDWATVIGAYNRLVHPKASEGSATR